MSNLIDNSKGLFIPSGYKNSALYTEIPSSNIAYYYNNGSVSNYVSTPNSSVNNITADIEIVVYWANQSIGDYALVSKYTGAVRSFLFNQGNDGRLYFYINNAASIYTSTVNNPLLNSSGWLKVFRSSTTGSVSFWGSTDSVTTELSSIVWTQIGNTITGSPSLMSSATTIVEIGSWGSGANWNLMGSIYRATIATSFNGTPVVDFNPNRFNWNSSFTQNGQTFTSQTGEVWTINSNGNSFIFPKYETLNYTRSGSGSRINKNGLIEIIGNNIPRLDYQTINGCPSLLFEPARTNTVLYNENYMNTPWGIGGNLSRSLTNILSRSGVTITAINSGSINNSSADILQQANSFSVTSGLTYTFSMIVKKTSTHNSVGIWAYNVNGTYSVNFNVDTLTYTPTVNSNFNNRTGGVISLSDSSFLCWETFSVVNTSVTSPIGIAPCNSGVFAYTSGNSISVTSLQLEQGSFYTSTIQTSASTTTRVADSISSANYSWIGLGNKGTIVLDYTVNGLSSTANGNGSFILTDTNNTSNNKLYLMGEFTTGFRIWDYINGIYLYNATQTVGNRYKVLVKYNTTYSACFVNGVKVFEKFDNIPLYFNFIKQLTMTNNSFRLHNFQTYPFALSDEDCIQITT